LSLPKALRDRTPELLTPNPLDAELQNEVEWVTGREVEPWFCLPERLQALVAREFGQSDPVEFDLLREIEAREEVELVGGDDHPADSDSDVRPPIIRFVNSLIADAAERRASDIHIEHERSGSTVRYRIDGKLRKVMTLPRYVAAGPTVSRVKIMADMDLAERRQPQDGRANLRIGNREVGLRVSTVPTKWGENVVLRLLDRENALVPLEELGFHGQVRERFERLIERPEGIVLVTGPTGSGKTTTLYAAMDRLNDEDPVEYELESLTQIQVDEAAGVTFPSSLRSVLRQDPDVIMVGEIRDRETASIACQAALTGHLVFSTLHTRNTTTAITRLVDMGVEPFKLADGLTAVTAQRLVRRLCTECARQVDAGPVDERLSRALEREGLGTSIGRAVGCRHCDYEGYRGRIALVELLEVDDRVRGAISDGATAEELRSL
ncbi:MAG: GspE/PulE family protein, partial [Gemmatimonadota bacterium]